MFAAEAVRSRGMKLFKVSPGGVFEGVFVSDHVCWVGQHWFRRAELCISPDDCPGCEWQASRQVGFAAVYTRGGMVGLLEISQLAFDRFVGLAGLERGGRQQRLCGLEFVATRRGRRLPLVLEPGNSVEVASAVSELRILQAVTCLYRLPSVQEGESRERYAERVLPTQRMRLEAAVAAEQKRLMMNA